MLLEIFAARRPLGIHSTMLLGIHSTDVIVVFVAVSEVPTMLTWGTVVHGLVRGKPRTTM